MTWNNAGSADGAAIDTQSLSYANWKSFDITSLVKKWKTGDYDANCGFIMIGSSTTNKSFFASEHSTTASRPYVVMTYTPDITLSRTSFAIDEGLTATLSVTSDIGDQTISWHSSSQAVATVSNGVVSAIKAGQTVITASTPDGASGSCLVYVTVTDGIYYIKNFSSDYYISAQNGTISTGTRIIQTSKTESTADGLWQIWRIQYLSDGRYSIRPLHRLSMGLGYMSDVSLMSIGTTDTISAINPSAQWAIQWASNGYVFRNNGNDDLALCPNKYWVNGMYINTSSYSEGNVFRWVLESASSSISNQVLLYDTDSGEVVSNAIRYVKAETTVSLSALKLAASFSSAYSINQSITWSTINPSVVTVDSATGAVTGVTKGQSATIIAKHIHNGVTYSKNYTVHVIDENVPVYKIVHFYDTGYNIREGNAMEAVQTYHNAVATTFDSIFGIKVFATFNAYTSMCDDCKLNQYEAIANTSLDSPCSHSPFCLNTYNIRVKLLSDVGTGNDTTSIVLWTGHSMTDPSNDRSNSDSVSHSVVITPYGVSQWDDSAEKYQEQTYTLLHELSHQLDAPDHYCYGRGESGLCSNTSCDMCYLGYSDARACVMGHRYDISTLSDEEMYCNDCYITITNHLANHH